MQNAMPRPDRITIMQYRPDPLYFLRLNYGATVTDGPILEDELSYATSIEFAIDWAADEFDLRPTEWKPCDITTG